MRNIHELERQWIRYKIRSYAPWVLIPIIFLMLGAIGSMILPLDVEEPSARLSTPEPIRQQPISSKAASSSSLAVAPMTSSSSAPEATMATLASPILTPSLNFIAQMSQKSSSASSVSSLSVSQEQASSQNTLKALAQPQIESTQPPKQEHVLSIGTNRDINDIEEVISRFKINKKPALSLFVAKRYYAVRQYREAYNYALITNELDPQNEESWLIAAKALVKLGNQEKAQHLLSKFIAHSNSVRAKMVLEQIQKGTVE